ncbi:MAG: ribonuclease HII [Candidatus Omnitrophica bacterium]|nr:ribonuclease HII [Candidatus Omnitrophota bacterium]
MNSKHDNLFGFDHEARSKSGSRFLFGIDEAGRGPLAGPVVSAAVCLKNFDFVNRVGDSKKLSCQAREKAFHEIFERGWVGIGIINEQVIDEVNILKATHFSMTTAVKDLLAKVPGDIREELKHPGTVKVIVDGNSYQGNIPFNVECVVQGDAKSFSIACASIVAKVYRDRMMDKYHKIYPQYGFSKHKGYPTRDHRAAIKRHGFSPIHRRTFTVS